MIYRITTSTVWLFFKIFFSLRTEGTDNIPKKGPFIIASNHVSYIDPMAVGALCKGKMNYMAKEELFKNRFLAWYFKKIHIFPLRRYAADSRAMREAIRRLKKGEGLLVFPEGTRGNDDTIREGKIGVSVLSFITQACVVPCYVKGSRQILPAGSRSFNKGNLSLFFGEPLDPPQVREGSKKQDYYDFAQKIMSRIKALKEGRSND